MSVQISDNAGGILTVRISGKLTESELTDLQSRTAAAIRTYGRVRVLVLAERFEGWQRGGQWDDFSFEEEYDPDIERMAIVGDRQMERPGADLRGQGPPAFSDRVLRAG